MDYFAFLVSYGCNYLSMTNINDRHQGHSVAISASTAGQGSARPALHTLEMRAVSFAVYCFFQFCTEIGSFDFWQDHCGVAYQTVGWGQVSLAHLVYDTSCQICDKNLVVVLVFSRITQPINRRVFLEWSLPVQGSGVLPFLPSRNGQQQLTARNFIDSCSCTRFLGEPSSTWCQCQEQLERYTSCHHSPDPSGYGENQAVTFKGLRPILEGFVVPMHEGACETGSQIPRA